DDVRRFIDALDQGLSPIRLEGLMSGGATETIPAGELAALLDRMIAEPDGANPALQVLGMRLHGDSTGGRPTAGPLVEVGRKLLVDARVYQDRHVLRDHVLAALA